MNSKRFLALMSGILILISSAACGKNAEIKNNTDSAGTTAEEEVIEEEKEQDYISSSAVRICRGRRYT